VLLFNSIMDTTAKVLLNLVTTKWLKVNRKQFETFLWFLRAVEFFISS